MLPEDDSRRFQDVQFVLEAGRQLLRINAVAIEASAGLIKADRQQLSGRLTEEAVTDAAPWKG